MKISRKLDQMPHFELLVANDAFMECNALMGYHNEPKYSDSQDWTV